MIPTYERREPVTQAVLSAFAQTLPPKEVIVVDDGSTDGTDAALAQLRCPLRYLRQDHRGVACARNLGVRAAEGGAIAFLDSDDRWLPNHLETIVQAFGRSSDAVLAATSAGFGPGSHFFSRDSGVCDPLPRLLIGNFVGNPSCTAIRRDALGAIGEFDEDLPASEWYDLCLRVACVGRFAFLRRRTVVRSRLPDRLSLRSAHEGRWLEGRERTGEKLRPVLNGMSSQMALAADSYLTFVRALVAYGADDLEGASRNLALSCELMPERSAEPWLVGGWLSDLPRAGTTSGRLQTFGWAAECWPDQRSDTAIGLRLHAALLAVRHRRWLLAVRLVSRAPATPTARFAARLIWSLMRPNRGIL